MPKKPIKCTSHFWDLLWFSCENGSQGERGKAKLVLLLYLAVLCHQLSCPSTKKIFETQSGLSEHSEWLDDLSPAFFCYLLHPRLESIPSWFPRTVGPESGSLQQGSGVEDRIVNLCCLLHCPVEIFSYFKFPHSFSPHCRPSPLLSWICSPSLW